MGCANGRSARRLLHSDCVVDEKTVELQKKENEGFGFVLRGAKADTPIEEFTPTPAFPALQYLESVDEGGVAWQAGLRTGDFLIEVNQVSVVKVGHRQVVNMIRVGSDRLLIKVVTVSRSPEPDDTARKKAPPPPKRAPTTALSMRSKSMTSELEELDKVDEAQPPHKNPDMKVATIKPRPSSRCLVTSEMNSLYHDRQGVAVAPPTVPGGLLGVPAKSTIKKQKSIGTEEETLGFLTPPSLKFSRSLSMPDTSEDIPPPPAVSPPSPPAYNAPASQTLRGYGARPGFTHNANAVSTMGRDAGTLRRGYYRQSSEQFESSRLRGRAPVPENPYSEVGKNLYVPAKPARRKGMLVKQPNVEDSPEKSGHKAASGPASMPSTPTERTCSSIPIPTIIIKEPSTSSSGKSSQGSSMEVEPTTPEHPPLAAAGGGGLRPGDSLALSNPFAAAIAGAVRDREKRLEARKNSTAFQSIDAGDEDGPTPAPRLRQSRSIDEGMFSGDERLRRAAMPPLSIQLGRPLGGGGGNLTDVNSPEPAVVREPLNTRTGQCPNLDSPLSLPATPPKSHNGAAGTYLHPVTGKALDPNSPLALALAARDRAMKEQHGHQNPAPSPPRTEPQSLPSQPGHKAELIQPLFIDTKLRSGMEAGFGPAGTATVGRAGRGGRGGRGGLRRQMTEQRYETDGAREQRQHQKLEQRKSAPVEAVEPPAGLLMVHTEEGGRESDRPTELKDPDPPHKAGAPRAPPSSDPPAALRRGVAAGESLDEPVKLPFRIPPPPLASVDIDDEFVFSEPLPPPLEFANSVDVPDDQAGAIAEMIQRQRQNGGPHHAPPPTGAHHRRGLLTNCMPPAFPPQDPERRVGDSCGEEADGRSGGEPGRAETTSTVSSVSTLSSEGGFCDLEGLYADGHAFLLDRPPVPPKPKGKPLINRTSLYHDALIEEPPEAFGSPPQAPPPPPGSDPPPAQRTSKLWGEQPAELRSPPATPDPKNTVISELSSILQQMNRERPPRTEGLDSPTGARGVFGSRTPADEAATRPVAGLSATPPAGLPPPPQQPRTGSPPDSGASSLTPCSSLPPSASPTLTEAFGLATPPLGGGYSLGSSSCGGSSRSPSPLSLLQAAAAASGKPFAGKPVDLWSKADVADWLESLNLAEHRDAFLDNEIEGAHLASLRKEDLIDLGVTRVGHRMNIERALKLLTDR
ncbi:LOW QUALITY PROTEIN: SH3 and multiple ankyrin repeat domains protein 2-like [Gadus macrocephalus]|uniref:LOW QUALITY PROTEIN: SH3 and multiple ankyrin repeat domains protein 2-like n=1 Tax=Gadus macrocephalus TaxID=80720 RepID=UPI0028CB3DED|nr:LOW QUALITY PROTEIN: SH3 and multiple ankyrin repeat domains protein 2-like [Gadus macrocephalus]